jgi:hypothetical protein
VCSGNTRWPGRESASRRAGGQLFEQNAAEFRELLESAAVITPST